MEKMNKFEMRKSEFWKRHNRSKRLEKKLISIALSHAKSRGIKVSVIPTYKESFIDPKDLHLIFDGENYDFSKVIEYSRRLNPSMYRKYEENSRICEEIFNSISNSLD